MVRGLGLPPVSVAVVKAARWIAWGGSALVVASELGRKAAEYAMTSKVGAPVPVYR